MSLWRRHKVEDDPALERRRPAPDWSPSDWSLPELLDMLPHPVVTLASNRLLRHANGAAQDLLCDALPALLRHPLLGQALDRLQGAAVESVDLAMDVPVRRVLRVAMRADRRAGSGGLILLSLSDRTEQEAVERMRADFVANASHELRTPLASLIGFIETLRGPAADDPPAQIRFLQIMAEQAARMNRLIDDLLSLSRIELTEHRPPTGQVALAELLRFTAASFEPRVKARGIRLELAMPADLPAVLGDEDQLGQVLQNLLDNAVKYGREGGAVRVMAAAAPAGGRWPARPGVTVAVADDGAGIPRQHLPRLTERFYRVDRGRSRAVGGTGLGLAIVKHIVNRHRGQLAIDSTEGQGATFTVWLPQLA